MIVLIYLLIAVGAIVSLFGTVWFLMVAFRTHVGWGLACLIIPFAGLVFLIKYWNESRIPFLVSLGGYLVSVVAVLGLAAHSASSAVSSYADVTYESSDDSTASSSSEDWWENQGEPEPTPSFEDPSPTVIPEPTPEVVPQPTVGAEQPLAVDDAPVEAVDVEPTPIRRRDRPWGEAVAFDALHPHIGRVIEIHSTDGRDFKAELSGVEEGGIKVIERVGAGHVEFSLPFETIVEIRVKP